ncbi:MAG: hypothetical protein CMJ89_14210 [Planctomycetes bacterium]|nr:hypothetical protein [Planctomycetota bacterium]
MVGAASLAVLALLGACSSRQDAPSGDIVLITIDTLRSDHLGLYGYGRGTTPGIDEWFQDGAIFERAYSAEASTSPSVVSLLSGKLPQEHGVRLFFQLLSEDVALVPDLLPPSYKTAAFVSNMVLTDEAIGFAGRFDHYDDFLDRRESKRRVFERNAETTTNAALLWLARRRDRTRPLFLWVHYIDPHGPYKPPSPFAEAFEHEGRLPVQLDRIPPFTRLEGVEDALEYIDRYDGEIRYVDRQIDRFLDGYARNQDPDQALILLMADHGETMADREHWFHHSFHVYEDIVHVPLLLRGPGVEKGRMQGLVSGIDVATTILAFAGGRGIAGGRGVDLRFGSAVDPNRIVLFEASLVDMQWRGARQGDGKWVAAVSGEKRLIPLRYRYDLREDPGEGTARDWQGSEASALLEQLIRSDPDPAGVPSSYAKGMKLSAPKVAPTVSKEQLEALRALGYAE